MVENTCRILTGNHPCKTIYEIKTCFPAADVDYAVNHVKIRLYIQLLVKVGNVVF